MDFDYIVIGAGASGLAFTALMGQKGFRVGLCESHSLVGGCSSYFERQGYLFDAGATTLAGLLPGRPLHQLIEALDLKLDLKKVDPGITFVFNDKKIKRFSNEEKWLAELAKYFPEINHELIGSKIASVNELGWLLSTKFSHIPIENMKDLLTFLTPDILSALKTLPHLLTSVENSLGLRELQNKDYLAMINELLFITAQNTMSDTPMLMGAMGLNYPNDTFYAMGGMKAFCQALSAKCSNLFLRHKVLSIKKINNGFEVTTSKNIFTTKKIVSTLPIWNHSRLFSDPTIKRKFSQKEKKESKVEDCWSAFMIYLTIPNDLDRSGQYFQIHCDSIPHCHSKSFFVSLSHPEDKLRDLSGKNTRQTVTISTHTKSSSWLDLPTHVYKERKSETEKFILDHLCQSLKIKRDDLENIMTGSPSTFIRYTNRHKGLVGGIPHSLKRNPINYLISSAPLKDFYLLGDTQFPGQGIAAVVLGAQNLVKRLT